MSHFTCSHIAQENGHGYFPSKDGQKNFRLETACKTQWPPLEDRCVGHPSHTQPQELGNPASWPYPCLSKIMFQESIREIPSSSKCAGYCSMISPCIYQKKESSLDSWDGTWFNSRLTWKGRLKYGCPGRKLGIPFPTEAECPFQQNEETQVSIKTSWEKKRGLRERAWALDYH